MPKIIDWDDHIGRRLRLRDLRVFFTVVQAGSLAKAGAELGVSQPAVSQIIADLEHNLGVRLFDRTTRGVEPTVYGRALLVRGRAAFDELRQGIRDIEFLVDPGAGEIRIGSPEFLMLGFVTAIIDRLAREFPRIVFHTEQGTNPSLRVALRERKVEAIIARRIQSVPEDDFVSEKLFDEQLFVVAAPQSRWVRRRKIDLSELLNEPWIMPTQGTLVRALIAEGFHAKGLTPPKPSVVSDSVALRNLLLATGRYLSVMPGSALHHAAVQVQAKILPVNMPAMTMTTEITTLKNRILSPVLQRFIACAHEIAKSTGSKSMSRSTRPPQPNLS
jgi:DNA-binding transcriptional LysR family regulator